MALRFPNHLMRRLGLFATLTVFLCSAYAMEKPSFHTQGTPTGKPTGPLKPGEYWWNPELSHNAASVISIAEFGDMC